MAASSEKRLEELELMVQNLNEQVRRNYVILNGDPDISFSSGVLTRLNRIETHFSEQAQLIQNLANQIAKQNELREQQKEITEAREEERTIIFQNMEKWIKILGPLLGGGLGLQLLFELLKLGG